MFCLGVELRARDRSTDLDVAIQIERLHETKIGATLRRLEFELVAVIWHRTPEVGHLRRFDQMDAIFRASWFDQWRILHYRFLPDAQQRMLFPNFAHDEAIGWRILQIRTRVRVGWRQFELEMVPNGFEQFWPNKFLEV
jgi:hypothetical protein